MSNYRRVYIPGSTYFFTLTAYKRKPIFDNEEVRVLLRQAMDDVKRKYPFEINAVTLLPDHLHCVLTLPDNDSDYSKRWSMIKRYVSQGIAKHAIVRNQNDVVGCAVRTNAQSRTKRRESAVWQRRFWKHAIRDARDYDNHVHYCYWNPVKHGYVQRVADWPYSTFHRDVKLGMFPLDWAVVMIRYLPSWVVANRKYKKAKGAHGAPCAIWPVLFSRHLVYQESAHPLADCRTTLLSPRPPRNSFHFPS